MPAATAAPQRLNQIRTVFTHPAIHATTRALLALDLLGDEALDFEPETITDELGMWAHKSIPLLSMQQVTAVFQLTRSDSFYSDLQVFMNFCNVLAGDSVDPAGEEPPEIAECAWAIFEASLHHPYGEETFWSPDVIAYMKVRLGNDGHLRAPSILRTVPGLAEFDATPGEFATEPGAFAGIFEATARRDDEISLIVAREGEELLRELDALYLQHGKTDQLKEAIRERIKKFGTPSIPA